MNCETIDVDDLNPSTISTLRIESQDVLQSDAALII
jgi:hypothetical protein